MPITGLMRNSGCLDPFPEHDSEPHLIPTAGFLSTLTILLCRYGAEKRPGLIRQEVICFGFGEALPIRQRRATLRNRSRIIQWLQRRVFVFTCPGNCCSPKETA